MTNTTGNNTLDDSVHTCHICGRTTWCFTSEETPEGLIWYCEDDIESIREAEDIEKEKYFLTKEERALVAKALDAIVFIDGGEHLDTAALDKIIAKFRA